MTTGRTEGELWTPSTSRTSSSRKSSSAATFAIVRREPVPLMVGHAGFHGPPGVNGRDLPAALELAYTVFAAYRRRGYAREAVAALLDWARSVHGIRRFLASIAPVTSRR